MAHAHTRPSTSIGKQNLIDFPFKGFDFNRLSEPTHLYANMGAPGCGKGFKLELTTGFANSNDTGNLCGSVVRGITISTEADIEMRKETDLGQIFLTHKANSAAGGMYPDGVVLELVRRRIHEGYAAGYRTFIIDGGARTLGQAIAIVESGRFKGAFYFALPDDQSCITRVAFRAHLSKKSRPDDGAIINRCDVFKRETQPAIDYLTQRMCLTRIDATAPVANQLKAVFSEVNLSDPVREKCLRNLISKTHPLGRKIKATELEFAKFEKKKIPSAGPVRDHHQQAIQIVSMQASPA